MKLFFVIAGLGTALLVTAPLAAQARSFTQAQSGTAFLVTVTKTQVRTAHDYNGYRARRGHILPACQSCSPA